MIVGVSPMARRRMVYEGKAKILYEGPEPGLLVQHFKDDATAFNAKNNDRIRVAVGQAKKVGLRPPISETDIKEIFALLEEQPVVFDNQTWNRRYRGFMDKIKTGSVFDVAEVMRDLYRLQVEKSLSFGEKKMLETARNLVVKEIAVARAKSEESTQAEIEQIFEKN